MAHNYIFSKKYEEMRDQVAILVMPGSITIQYDSKYYGQIAPHIRNMIDTNADTSISPSELRQFFATYGRELDSLLRQQPLYVDGTAHTMRLLDVEAPGILSDSLLAPLKLKMVFGVPDVPLPPGKHKIAIPPRLLFLNGTHLIEMAKRRVAFTPDQEKAIGRFLLVNVLGSDDVTFEDVFPGFIRRDGQMARIYGVFYDKSVMKEGRGKASALRITIVRRKSGRSDPPKP